MTSFQSIGNVEIAGWLVEPYGIPIKGAVIQFPGYSEVLFRRRILPGRASLCFRFPFEGIMAAKNRSHRVFRGFLLMGFPMRILLFIARSSSIYSEDLLSCRITRKENFRSWLWEKPGRSVGNIPGWPPEGSRGSCSRSALVTCHRESLKITDAFPYREVSGYIRSHPEEEQRVKDTLAL